MALLCPFLWLSSWRRRFRVPWTARRSNQSILKEISPEYSLEGLMWSWNSNTLATWCEELTHWKRPRCWERMKAEGEGDDRGWDGWMASPTLWTWVWVSSRSWWWTGKSGMLQSMGLQSWTQLSNRTELSVKFQGWIELVWRIWDRKKRQESTFEIRDAGTFRGHSIFKDVAMSRLPWLSSKESAHDAGHTGDMGSIPWLGRSSGGGHGKPL